MGLDIIARAVALTARTDAAVARGRTVPIGRFADLPTQSIDPSHSAVITSGYTAAGTGRGIYVADATATAALALAHPRACKATANGRYFRLLPDDTGAIPAEALRDSADADDTAAHLAAGAYAKAVGASFVGYTGRVWTTCNAFYGYPGYMMSFPQGVYAKTNGATFRAGITSGAGQYGFYYSGVLKDDGSAGVVTAAIAAGDKAIHVAGAAAFSVGDWVLFRLGDVPIDPAETYSHGFARIVAVNAGAGTVTLDRAMPRPFTAAEISAAVVNKGLRKVEPITGVSLGDAIYDDTDTNSLSGMVLLLTQDCRVGTVGGRNLAVAAFVAQYSYGFHVDKIYNYDSPNAGPNTGGGCRFAEARGTIGSIVLRNNDGSIAAEAATVLKIGYVEDDNYLGTRTLFQMNGRSHVDVDRVLLLGLGGQSLFDPQDNSQFSCRHLHVRTATMPAYLGKFGKHVTDSLTLEIGGAPPEVYRAAQGYWVEKIVQLRNSMADSVLIAPPNTLIAESRIYASSGVTGGMNYLNVGRTSGAVSDSLAGTLVPGSWVSDANKWDICGFNSSRRGEGVSMYVDTAAAGGAVPNLSGQFLICRFLVIPDASAANAVDGGDWYALSEANQHYGSTTWDPPSVAAGAKASTTITVTGCHKGDFAETTFTNDLQGMIMTAQVLADNAVTVTLTNPTAGAIDLASGTLRARVRR